MFQSKEGRLHSEVEGRGCTDCGCSCELIDGLGEVDERGGLELDAVGGADELALCELDEIITGIGIGVDLSKVFDHR